MERGEYRFEIALSFAGDNKRDRVREVATLLLQQVGDDKVFFDEWYEAELAGPDAHLVLQDIYCKKSRLVVACLCNRYDEKPWTQEEWRAIQSLERALRDAGDGNVKRMRFLPLQFGDGDVDGVFDTAIVPDVRERSPAQIAELIRKRLALSVGDEPNEATPTVSAAVVSAQPADHTSAGSTDGATATTSVAADVTLAPIPLEPRRQTVFDRDVERRLSSLFATRESLACARKLLEDHGSGLESVEGASAADAARTLCSLEASSAVHAWTVSVHDQLGLLNSADEKRATWDASKLVHLTLLARLVDPEWLDWWREQSRRQADARLVRLAILLAADVAPFGVEVLAGRLIDGRWVQFSEEADGPPTAPGQISSETFSGLDEPLPEIAVEKLGRHLMAVLKMNTPDKMEAEHWRKLDFRLRREVADSHYLLIPGNDQMFASEATLVLLCERLPNLPKFLLSEPDVDHPNPFVCDGDDIAALVGAFWNLNPAGGRV